MSGEPVGGSQASTAGPARVSLRRAFGLAGADAAPDISAAALHAGAVRALLGRPPSEAEQAAAMASLLPALQNQPPEMAVEGLLRDLLDSTGAQAVPGRGEDIFAAVVNGVFRAALGREAGVEGVDAWRAVLGETFEQVTREEFVFQFVSATVAGGEFINRYSEPMLTALRARLLPPVASVGISTHISLGVDGFTSSLLKRFGLKRWSGPFDWLSASPVMIRAILAEDFETFLDPDEWRPIPLEDRPDGRFWQCHHPRYEQKHQHACILHNHDMTQEWSQVAMLRCVERFRKSVRSLASKLVLQVVREGDNPGRDFLSTAETLDRWGRNIHYVMISLLPGHTDGPFPEVEPALSQGAHRLLRARLMAPLEGVEAKDMLDEVVLLRAALAAPMLGQDLQKP